MVENITAAPQGALDTYRAQLAAITGPVGMRVSPSARHLNVRADAAGIAAFAAVLGVEMPGASRWAQGAEGETVVWLGPNEWLVIAPLETSLELEQQLRKAAAGASIAVTDQSGQRLSVVVSGDAAGLLSKGTAIDLHPAVFVPGTAIQSFVGQAVVVLLARGDNEIELLVRTSFARYVGDWLRDALVDPLAYPADFPAVFEAALLT